MNDMKFKSHFSECVFFLQHCRESLSQPIKMIIETLVAICSQKNIGQFSENMQTTMNVFLTNHSQLEILKS